MKSLKRESERRLDEVRRRYWVELEQAEEESR